ncbi:YHYH protein [Pseudoalteromonas aurantia]|nr:YHYH protein [Pseudoalteromonas aurantia]
MTRQRLLGLMLVSSGMLSGCGGGSDSDSVTTPNTDDGNSVVVSNSAPVANAGSEQSVSVGAVVTLSSSQSQDADGDTLSFEWQFITKPASSQSSLANATSSNTTFTPDIAGQYTVGLVVNDGTVNSSQDTVTVNASAVNQMPIANAGSDQQVVPGTEVTLSGAASQDPDGDTLSYQWLFVSKPNGSNAALTDAQLVNAKFTADVAGNYELGLTVSDGQTESTQDKMTVVAQASTTNQAPIANAGSDQTVRVADVVTVSGSLSSDADNDTLSYTWSVVSKPSQSNTVLSSSTSESVQLTPDSAGTYQLSLVVNDGKMNSVADMITITAEAQAGAPTASAGDDQSVIVGDFVALSGSQSSGEGLTYQWQLVSKPDNSSAQLNNKAQVSAEFNADIAGVFELSLTVTSGTLSATDTLKVTASNTSVDITDKIFTNEAVSCRNYEGSYFSNVSDIKRAADFTGDVMLTVNNSTCTITMNSIPNHDFNDETASFATNASEQNLVYNVPITPTLASSITAQGIGTTEGVLLNGVTLDLLPAACYDVGSEPIGQEKIGCGADQNDNPWRYDPMSSLNAFGTDSHNAHTQPSGKYHYHGNPVAMFNQTCGSRSSAVIGFAADGYPIYGSCFKDSNTGIIRKATSSYVLKNNGGARQAVSGYTTPVGGTGAVASSNYDGQFRGDWEYQANQGDLDECNGMTVDGQYGYYITDTFPWVLGCFKGNLDTSFTAGPQNLQRRSHSHGDAGEHRH